MAATFMLASNVGTYKVDGVNGGSAAEVRVLDTCRCACV